MDWFYVSDNQQRGPVAEAQMEELVQSGAVGPDTLVWRSGLAEWQPLHAVWSSGTSTTPPTLVATAVGIGGATCAECGQVFSHSDMVRLNQSWVCAGCKPIFLQRLAEGAAPSSAGAIWRSARQMITRSETSLPDRCVRCNAPANGYRLKRTLYWHSPYFYLLILISLLIYVIVALCVRKKAILQIGLCEQHRKRRTIFIAGGWLGVLAGVALLIGGIAANGSGWLIMAGLFVAIAAAIVGVSQAGVVSAAKIEDGIVRVKGAGPAFLDNFPEWSGPR